jgi:dihydroneopterin aldolase
VCAEVAVIAEGRFDLLERFAAEIAAAVLVHERVGAVTVSVRKLRPPVPQLLDTSGVRIRRSRSVLP